MCLRLFNFYDPRPRPAFKLRPTTPSFQTRLMPLVSSKFGCIFLHFLAFITATNSFQGLNQETPLNTSMIIITNLIYALNLFYLVIAVLLANVVSLCHWRERICSRENEMARILGHIFASDIVFSATEIECKQFAIQTDDWYILEQGFLNCGSQVATHKWVSELSQVGRKNVSCKNIITVITSPQI